MSIKGDIIEHCYIGKPDFLNNSLKQTDSATSPNGVITAPKGTHFMIDYNGNAADKDVYINTDGSTAWTLIHNETA